MHQLTDALDGDLGELIDEAVSFFNSEKLKQATEGDPMAAAAGDAAATRRAL